MKSNSQFAFRHFSNEDSVFWNSIVIKNSLPLNYSHEFLSYKSLSSDILNLSFTVEVNGNFTLVPLLIPKALAGLRERPSKRMRLLAPHFDSRTTQSDVFMVLEYMKKILAENGFDRRNILFETQFWLTNPKCSENDFLIKNIDKNINFSKSGNLDLIIDLSQYSILTLRRNHVRSIKKSIANGEFVELVNQNSNFYDIENAFEAFTSAFASKSRVQDSISESDFIKRMIYNGSGCLFVSRVRNRRLGFLFCDFNEIYARGWRQVNSAELLPGEFPRTFLEFEALKYFSQMGCKTYQIGEILHEFESESSSKIQSILQFKLGFNPIQNKRFFLNFD